MENKKMDVDLVAYEVKKLQHNHALSEQVAVEILKMQQLSNDLDSIRNVLQEIYNTI